MKNEGLLIDSYVLDVLMRDLVEHDKHPSAFVVYLFLWRKTLANGQRSVAISYRDLSEATGVSKSAVQIAVKLLKRRKLISVRLESPTAVPVYRPLRPWIRRTRSVGV